MTECGLYYFEIYSGFIFVKFVRSLVSVRVFGGFVWWGAGLELALVLAKLAGFCAV